MHEKKNIESLFQRYLDNQCSPREIRLLLSHFKIDENAALLRKLIQNESEKSDETRSNADHTSLLETTFQKIKKSIAAGDELNKALVVPFYKQVWFRACAAAVVIFLLIVPAYYLVNKKNERTIAQNENRTTKTDVQPGRSNAILTLDNGQTIMLDSAADGTLAQQGDIKVLKMNDRIDYQSGNGKANEKPVYNTITTAKGNDYQLVLSDGSKVWLNAASSIRFPTAFTGNERKVEITGEAYFEVAHNPAKPFKVDFKNAADGNGEIEVLGTHFNVNTYTDEQDVKTTLLEGSVRITGADKSQRLSPGEQATLTADAITLKKDVDVSQVTAWKDGYFLFNNTDIQTIMRQVARWYDVDVQFEGKIPVDGFTGRISRNVPLSKFLKVLELNDLKVRTEGRTVTVLF